MSNIISWWTVKNTVDDIMVNGSLRHTLKEGKKIQSRTRALNVELKKFSTLKCYGEYVTIKTEILRNISDNDDTDDEPLARSAVALDGNSNIDNVTIQCNRRRRKNDLSECKDEEELEEQQPCEGYEQLQKKSHPTITCTEIVKSKYTIIRDKEDRSVDESCSVSIHPPDQQSLENKKTFKLDRPLDEVRRVGQLKDVNLSYDNSASDNSQDSDDEMLVTTDNLLTDQKGLSEECDSRPIMSTLSNCNTWYSHEYDSAKKDKLYQGKCTNHPSLMSSPLRTSDGNNVIDYPKKKGCDAWDKKSVKKSIKSQIAEQEFDDSSTEAMIQRDEVKSTTNTVTNEVPSEAESLRYVLRNLCSNRSQSSSDHLSTSEIEYSTLKTSIPTSQCPKEVLSRPVKLQEFVHQQQLIATRELSTININDIESTGEQDDNKQIWLMEIPKSIVMGDQLRGKKIELKKKRIKIGDASYKSIGRHAKSLSCILSVGKETANFEIVNLRPLSSIVVRQESYEMDDASLASSFTSLSQSSAPRREARNGGFVPFPNNLKTRNPLVTSNSLNEQLNLD